MWKISAPLGFESRTIQPEVQSLFPITHANSFNFKAGGNYSNHCILGVKRQRGYALNQQVNFEYEQHSVDIIHTGHRLEMIKVACHDGFVRSPLMRFLRGRNKARIE